jgi:phosphoribosylamine--glycine ligase
MWNVLVVGGGAREHTLTWKLRQSARIERVFCAPGNAGTAPIATNLPFTPNQIGEIADWCAANQIDLVVVGPEEPLARGLADVLTRRGIAVFGPSAACARIESSKSWAKEILRWAEVPTANYRVFQDATAAWDAVRSGPFPVVLKADGLAAGKGVVVAQTPTEAQAAIRAALEEQVFGEAGRSLLVEEFLAGEELSLLAVVDGRTVVPMVPARDHKRIGEGETGPNTGGMGAYAPTHLADRIGPARLSALVVEPVVEALAQLGLVYRGVLYAGLILTADGPKVIEFNCRMGDPETQVLLPLLADDFAELAFAAATGQLSQTPLTFQPGYCCGVVLAAAGYPGPYATGAPISGEADVDASALVFHAGTRASDGRVVTAGGRVLTVVGQGATLAAARAHAYANAERIHFAGAYFRRDIGAREVEVVDDAESAPIHQDN